MASIVTGVLFLLAMVLAPLVTAVPFEAASVATASPTWPGGRCGGPGSAGSSLSWAGVMCGLAVALAVGYARPLTTALGGQPHKAVGLGPAVGILLRFMVGLPVQRLIGGARSPMRGLAGGLAGGMFGGFAAGLANLVGFGRADWPAGGLGAALAVGAAIGPAVGLAGGFSGGLLGGFTAGLIAEIGAGPASGAVNGLAAGVAVALASATAARRRPADEIGWSRIGLLGGAAAGLAVTIAAGLLLGAGVALAAGLTAAAVTALVSGLTSVEVDPSAPSSPRSVLRRDRRAFFRYAAAAGLAEGLVGGLSNGFDAIRIADLRASLTALLANGRAVGLAAAIVSATIFGLLHAAWVPFTVTRIWLAMRGHLPWRLMTFLADAHQERGVLRQVGGVYNSAILSCNDISPPAVPPQGSVSVDRHGCGHRTHTRRTPTDLRPASTDAISLITCVISVTSHTRWGERQPSYAAPHLVVLEDPSVIRGVSR